jgi:predicted nucleic acid-binding protein
MGTRTVIISNSTPLINFATIQRLDILEGLFGKIWIPKAVERELLEKGQLYPSTEALKAKWSKLIETQAIKNILLCTVLKLNIDDGEAEAITLAIEQNVKWLLLDEERGRTIAASYNISCIGSIGCLIRAKKIGMIPAIKLLLDAMQAEARFWVSTTLYRTILKEYNE